MVRHLFTAASVLSLALCFTTAILWVGTRRTAYTVRWVSPARRFGFYLYAGSGAMNWEVQSFGPATVTDPSFDDRGISIGTGPLAPDDVSWPSDFQVKLRHWGIIYAIHDDPFVSVDRVAVLPDWLVLLMTAVMPVLRARSGRPRFAVGLCTSCGYDLRASTERCPECGMPIPAKS